MYISFDKEFALVDNSFSRVSSNKLENSLENYVGEGTYKIRKGMMGPVHLGNCARTIYGNIDNVADANSNFYLSGFGAVLS